MLVALALVWVPVSAPAQGSKPGTLADLAKYKAPDRERVLYEGEKKEGRLVWYKSLVPHKHIAKVFQAKYPAVLVDVYRAAGNTLATRLLEERRAKRYLADTIESTPPQVQSVHAFHTPPPVCRCRSIAKIRLCRAT